MTRKAGWPIRVITVAAALAYPLILHLFVVKNARGPIGITLALLPIGGYIFWLLRFSKHPLRTALILVLAVVLLGAAWSAKWIDFSVAYYFEHVLFNSLLLILFGSSLLPGREPLVTRLARRVHGSLPIQIAAYTVKVTWLWTIYFAATIVVSLLLYYFAPLRVWSLFANVLAVPIVILVFVGEYWYRTNHIRDFPHKSIFAGMKAMIDHADGKPEIK